MAYQALYRKWRPRTFSDVVGQEAVVRTLRHQVDTGRIAHAYLLCGCRGTGKTSIAKIMSRAVNCLHPNGGDPCGECESCQAILNETTMDVVEMDAASHSRVEEMRDLLDRVMYPPQFGKYKVYIIDEVHMLSASAFNALLKTLEEPPAYVIFILATTEPQKLPATILSRVQRYDFGRIPAALIADRMRLALSDMGMDADDEALQIVAQSAEGAMRDAFSILDMCVAGAQGSHIAAADVRQMLGIGSRDFLFDFFDCFAAYDEAGVMRKVDEVMRAGREPQVCLRELSTHARALLTVLAVPKNAAEVLEVTKEDEQRYREQAARFTYERLLRMLDILMNAEGTLRYASTPRIGLESAVLHACERSIGEDHAALIERIAELEKKLSDVETAIRNGTLRAAKPARLSTPEAQEQTPPPVPQKPIPKTDQELWTAFMAEVQQKLPPVHATLKTVRFTGVEDDKVCCTADIKTNMAGDILSKPRFAEQFNAILTELGGRPLTFTFVPLSDDPGRKAEKTAERSEQKLMEVFDRETVQISEGEPR